MSNETTTAEESATAGMGADGQGAGAASEEDEAIQLDQGVQDLLAQIIASPTGGGGSTSGSNGRWWESQRKAYRRKLQTFTASAYFAKPVAISPIVCALAGWEIAPAPGTGTNRGSALLLDSNKESSSSSLLSKSDKALLKCCDCQAHLAILIPSTLSAAASQKLVAHYQQQLWEAHSVACRHRKPVEYFITTALKNVTVQEEATHDNTNNNSKTILVVPSLVAHVIPESTLDLLEQSSWPIVRKQVEEMSLKIPSSADDGEPEMKIEGPEALLNAIDHVAQVLLLQEKESQPKYLSTMNAATALILTGWSLVSEQANDAATSNIDQDEEVAPSAVECSFCLSRQPLVPPTVSSPFLAASGDGDGDGDGDGEEPRRKRQRTSSSKWNRPLDAHRYYCPWVCGMASAASSPTATPPPAATPFWQILSGNLLRKAEAQEGTTIEPVSASEVYRLLRAGVSSRRMTATAEK